MYINIETSIRTKGDVEHCFLGEANEASIFPIISPLTIYLQSFTALGENILQLTADAGYGITAAVNVLRLNSEQKMILRM